MAVPAGSYLRIRRDEVHTPVCWHDVSRHWQRPQDHNPPYEVLQRVRAAVTESVRAHLVSDVPVSVFLSGGIDSGAMAGLISQLGAKVEGVTIGFQEFGDLHNDEVPAATLIATHYGLDHSIRKITRSEFEEDLPRFMDAMDQPTIDGVNTGSPAKSLPNGDTRWRSRE
jgi:asparagine synthase (glutamine-hydrolysing)